MFTFISYLIKNNIVPLQQTSVYRLVELYNTNCLSPSDKWTDVTSPGTKGLLSAQGLKLLVDTAQNATLGGVSMPLSKIKQLVKDRIIFEWYTKYEYKKLPKICKGTL